MSSIYHITGNPFVDAGIITLCALCRKDDPTKLEFSDLRRHVHRLPKLYLRWKMAAFFGPNPKFANPSIRRKEDREAKYARYLGELLQHVTPVSQSGSCMACGSREANAERVFREIYPLTGSGDFLNCFSFFESGLPLCSTCVLATQFSPFYMISKGGRLALIHSHNVRLMLNIARAAVRHIRGLTAAGGELAFYAPNIYLGKRNEEFLVNLVYKDILKRGELYGHTAIRMYVFTNYGQINELDYIDLSTHVFKFLEEASTGALRQCLDELFESSGPGIYPRLVAGENIELFFINRKERRMVGGWQLFELYLRMVEEMDPKRIETIKKVGEKLYQYLKKTGFKKLDDLEMVENYQTFFVELNKIQKEAPVWEIEDLTSLFPEDKEGRILWRETRNILLGYIYGLKHKDEEVRKP